MQRQNILQTLLFVIFFGIGTSVVAASILCDDLLSYYRNKKLLRSAEETLNRLESLNADYDALLKQLEENPDVIKRLESATLGVEPSEPNTIYPRVTAEQLDAARAVLAEDSNQRPSVAEVPEWIVRCSEPFRRIVLFSAGAFLILVSFICFSPAKQCSKGQ